MSAKSPNHKRLILLDAHAILHRAYHALPDFATSSGLPTGALYGLATMLIKIIEDLKPDYIVACYDLPAPTHRHEIYKEYKLGRKKADEELVAQLESSREVFTALNIPIYDKPGFEADDIIGTIVEEVHAKRGTGPALEVIIASGDMDTMQLISGTDVKVYTLKKGIKDTIMYDEEAIKERFGFGPELIPDYKGLRGDPSDNIIGVKGIGDKTATNLIVSFGTIEQIYQELAAGHDKVFVKAGITPRIVQLLKDSKEEAEFSKMLSTIRRDAPITFTLPEQSFKEGLDMGKAKALWTKLEFRTIQQRLEKAVRPAVGQVTVEQEDDEKEPVVEAKTNQTALFETIPADELERTGTALWLVNSNYTNPSLEDMLNFANVDDFASAQKVIYAELDKRKMRTIYDTIEFPLIEITHAMEKRGIKVDRTILATLSKTYHATVAELETKIWKAAGMEFNISSPKQLGEVLFDKLGLTAKNLKKTEGGARSTRESELEKLRDLHPIVPWIFEYRELQKLLSTYIDAIPPLLDQNDRLHTDFVPAGSTTGRMASLDPNLQNIPVKSELGRAIRGAFVAEKGYKLCSFDYSQIELRIAAFLSGDEKLIEIFRKGEDVHTSVAAFVFKVPAAEVTSEMRRQAKVINFGIIYGMGVNALKQNLGSTRDEAQKFYNEYFATFSTLASYLEGVKVAAARTGYTETFFGRRRYFDGLNSKLPFIRAQAERMAVNAPIQGTGADVIKLAMIQINTFIHDEKLEKDVFALLQVHDELIYEISEKRAEELAPKIRAVMESVVDPKETSGVVLKSSLAIGNNWGELK